MFWYYTCLSFIFREKTWWLSQCWRGTFHCCRVSNSYIYTSYYRICDYLPCLRFVSMFCKRWSFTHNICKRFRAWLIQKNVVTTVFECMNKLHYVPKWFTFSFGFVEMLIEFSNRRIYGYTRFVNNCFILSSRY